MASRRNLPHFPPLHGKRSRFVGRYEETKPTGGKRGKGGWQVTPPRVSIRTTTTKKKRRKWKWVAQKHIYRPFSKQANGDREQPRGTDRAHQGLRKNRQKNDFAAPDHPSKESESSARPVPATSAPAPEQNSSPIEPLDLVTPTRNAPPRRLLAEWNQPIRLHGRPSRLFFAAPKRAGHAPV